MQNKINFAKTGVMVQCVCPNFVDTNLIRSDFFSLFQFDRYGHVGSNLYSNQNLVDKNLTRSDFSSCFNWILAVMVIYIYIYYKISINSDHGRGIVFCLHLSDLCREGIADAEKAKEKIKKKFGICTPDDVAKVCHVT